MSGMRAVLLGVFLTVFVVDVSGFGMTLPAATPGLRVTSPRTCLSMSTLTQSRTRTLKNGPMRKRDQLGEWFDEITSEIFSGEKLPLSAKDLADHMLSSYWRESPESSDIFGAPLAPPAPPRITPSPEPVCTNPPVSVGSTNTSYVL